VPLGTDQILCRKTVVHPDRYVSDVYLCQTSHLTNQTGQRYDVVINANQTVGNYWFRVGLGTACSRNDIFNSGRQVGAILHYDGADNSNPTTTGETLLTHCDDETGLVPFVPNTVPSNIVPNSGRLDVGFFTGEANLFRWTINGSTHIVDWQHPILEKVLAGNTNYGPNSNVYEMQTKDQVCI